MPVPTPSSNQLTPENSKTFYRGALFSFEYVWKQREVLDNRPCDYWRETCAVAGNVQEQFILMKISSLWHQPARETWEGAVGNESPFQNEPILSMRWFPSCPGHSWNKTPVRCCCSGLSLHPAQVAPETCLEEGQRPWPLQQCSVVLASINLPGIWAVLWIPFFLLLLPNHSQLIQHKPNSYIAQQYRVVVICPDSTSRPRFDSLLCHFTNLTSVHHKHPVRHLWNGPNNSILFIE